MPFIQGDAPEGAEETTETPEGAAAEETKQDEVQHEEPKADEPTAEETDDDAEEDEPQEQLVPLHALEKAKKERDRFKRELANAQVKISQLEDELDDEKTARVHDKRRDQLEAAAKERFLPEAVADVIERADLSTLESPKEIKAFIDKTAKDRPHWAIPEKPTPPNPKGFGHEPRVDEQDTRQGSMFGPDAPDPATDPDAALEAARKSAGKKLSQYFNGW